MRASATTTTRAGRRGIHSRLTYKPDDLLQVSIVQYTSTHRCTGLILIALHWSLALHAYVYECVLPMASHVYLQLAQKKICSDWLFLLLSRGRVTPSVVRCAYLYIASANTWVFIVWQMSMFHLRYACHFAGARVMHRYMRWAIIYRRPTRQENGKSKITRTQSVWTPNEKEYNAVWFAVAEIVCGKLLCCAQF